MCFLKENSTFKVHETGQGGRLGWLGDDQVATVVMAAGV